MTVGHCRTWHGAGITDSIPQWSCNCDSVWWVVVVVIQSTVQWHLWAEDVYPSAKCMWSCRHPLPLHITWSLHPSSMDAVVDIHGRSHNFLLIHTREVLLAWCWSVTIPLSSSGVLLLSLPLGVGLTGGGASTSVPCLTGPHSQGNASFWHNEEKSVVVEDVWLSMLVCHFIWGDICHDLMYHLMRFILPPVFNHPLSLEGISLH